MRRVVAALLVVSAVPTATAGEVSWQGKAELYGAAFRDEGFAEARLRPRVSQSVRDDFSYLAEAEIRIDSWGIAHGVIDSPVERSYPWILGVRQAFATFTLGALEVRLGKEVIDWSVTDEVSPSDNLSPRDWTDPTRWERVGVPAVRAKLGHDTFVEAVYVPWFTPSKLPESGNRWQRDLPPGVTRSDWTSDGAQRPQAAVRAGATLAGFDLGASAFVGYSYSPDFVVAIESTTSLELQPVYRHQRVYALSLATGRAGYNLRGEVGYFDQDGAPDFAQYVIGCDREWSGIFRPDDSLVFLLQYVGDLDRGGSPSVPLATDDLRRVWHQALLTQVKYAASGGGPWAFQLEGGYNLGGRDSYFQPTISWRRSRLEVRAGVDLFGGPASTFFGGYRDDRRLFADLWIHF